MFTWNEAMITYLDRAAKHTKYYTTIAAHIGRNLKKNDRICDVGCGLGYLSLALSPYAGQVDAIDCSSAALDVLCRNLTETKIGNITPIQTTIETLQAAPYDAMVFCYFGKMAEIAAFAKQFCSKDIYVIKGRSAYHLFSKNSDPTHRETAEMAEYWLKAHQIPYEQTLLDLEFGQPLLDRKDAEQFAALYGKSESQDFSWVEKRLGLDPYGKYEWYMPLLKPVTLFRFTLGSI